MLGSSLPHPAQQTSESGSECCYIRLSWVRVSSHLCPHQDGFPQDGEAICISRVAGPLPQSHGAQDNRAAWELFMKRQSSGGWAGHSGTMTAATDSNWGGEGCLNYSSQNRGAGGSGRASYQGSTGSLPCTSGLEPCHRQRRGDRTPARPWGCHSSLAKAAGQPRGGVWWWQGSSWGLREKQPGCDLLEGARVVRGGKG